MGTGMDTSTETAPADSTTGTGGDTGMDGMESAPAAGPTGKGHRHGRHGKYTCGRDHGHRNTGTGTEGVSTGTSAGMENQDTSPSHEGAVGPLANR